MAAIDYLTLRSTLMYTSPGVLAPAGSILTVAASGMQAPNTFVSSIGDAHIRIRDAWYAFRISCRGGLDVVFDTDGTRPAHDRLNICK